MRASVIDALEWASVIEDFSAAQGQAFQFTLPAATDGDEVTFELKGIPDSWTFDNATRILSGTHNEVTIFDTLEYIAKDARNTITSSFSITIDNVAPVWETPLVINFQKTAGIAFIFTLPDAEDIDALVYELKDIPNGWAFDPTSGELSGSFANIEGGMEELLYEVSDGGTTVSTTITLEFVGNTPPVWNSAEREFSGLIDTSSMFILPTALDHQELVYSLSSVPTGWVFDQKTGTLFGTSAIPTSFELLYLATDMHHTITATITVSLIEQQPSQWVQHDTTHGVDKNTGGVLILPELAGEYNSGNTTYSYKISQGFLGIEGLPSGWTYDSTAHTISVAENAAEETYLFTYTASEGSLYPETTLTIAVADAPMWAQDSIQFEMLPSLHYTFALTDPISDYGVIGSLNSVNEIVYKTNTEFVREIANLPAGMSFDASTGVLSGSFSGSDTELVFGYTVSDLVGKITNSITIDIVNFPTWAENGVLITATPDAYYTFKYALDDPITEFWDRQIPPLTLYDYQQNVIARNLGYYDTSSDSFIWNLLARTSGTYILLPDLPTGSSIDGNLSQAVGTQPEFGGNKTDLDVGYSMLGNLGAGEEKNTFEMYYGPDEFYEAKLQGNFADASMHTILASEVSSEDALPDYKDFFRYQPFSLLEAYPGGGSTDYSPVSYINQEFLSPINDETPLSYTLSADAPDFFHPYETLYSPLPSGPGYSTLTLTADDAAEIAEDTDYVLSILSEQLFNDPNAPPISEDSTVEEFSEHIQYYYYDMNSTNVTYNDFVFGTVFFYIMPDLLGEFLLPDGMSSENPEWSGDLPELRFRLTLYHEGYSRLGPVDFTITSKESLEDSESENSSLTGQLGINLATFTHSGAVLEFNLDTAAIIGMIPDGYSPFQFDFVTSSPYGLELLGFADSEDPEPALGSILDYLDG